MRRRSYKPVLYLYLEAKKAHLATESHYLNNIAREYDIKVQPFSSLSKLKVAIKNKERNDLVVAVIDVDVDGGNKGVSLQAREKEILKIGKAIPEIEIYLSNRFWENWVVYHFKDYSRFAESADDSPIPDYLKHKDWYTKNRTHLLETLPVAMDRSRNRRRNLGRQWDNHFEDQLPTIYPGFLKQMYDSGAFSYVDLLVEKIISQYENRSKDN